MQKATKTKTKRDAVYSCSIAGNFKYRMFFAILPKNPPIPSACVSTPCMAASMASVDLLANIIPFITPTILYHIL